MDWLNGKKTYLCAIGMGLVGLAFAFGILTRDQFEMLMGWLAAGMGAALKSGQVTESAKTVAQVAAVQQVATAKVIAKVQGAEDLEKDKACFPKL